MAHAARALGLGVMLGCMVESGLGIAAGAQIATLCDHVDLDGNLLLADDPWPGVEFVDGVQRPVRRARPRVSRDDGYLILAEGLSGDPHYGKTARGVIALPAASTVVALLDSTRAGETQDGVPDRRHGRRGAPLRADDRARRRRHAGRPLPAGVARAAAGVHRERASTSRTGCTSSSATTPSWSSSRRGTASSCATCASRRAGLNVPTGANLELDGAGSCSPSARTARSGR